MTRSLPAAIDVLARVDEDERSLRVQRERFVGDDGRPRWVVSLVLYRRLLDGKWHREKSVSVRKRELGPVIQGFALAAPGVTGSDPTPND